MSHRVIVGGLNIGCYSSRMEEFFALKCAHTKRRNVIETIALCSIVIGSTQFICIPIYAAPALRSKYMRFKKVCRDFWVLLFFSDVIIVLFHTQKRILYTHTAYANIHKYP
jgi:hypothetical protein